MAESGWPSRGDRVDIDRINLAAATDRGDHRVMTRSAATLDDTLRRRWLVFARNECGDYSPMYRAICEAVADDVGLLRFTASGPTHARQPNLLLAAVHSIVLRDDHGDDPTAVALAASYAAAGVEGATVDPEVGRRFVEFCRQHEPELGALLASRFTQTNECGRSAPLALALHRIAHDHPAPAIPSPATPTPATCPATLALIDAGCSAGLNLAVDRYRIDFGRFGAMQPARPTDHDVGGEPVTVYSELRGPHVDGVLPLPPALDVIGWRVGLERAPVDLADDEARRWLLACVWPDHRARLDRARRALEQLAADPPRVLVGDLVADVGRAIDAAPPGHLVTVITSWAAAYLPPAERERFRSELSAASFARPVVWLGLEAPGVVEGVSRPAFDVESETAPSLVGYLRFEQGVVTPVTLGWTHPHGAWFAPTARMGSAPIGGRGGE